MATTKQRQAAKRNVKKAQAAAKSKRTIANLPAETRKALGEQAAKGRRRGGEAGHALEDRKQLDIPGRSKMGKWELIDAIRKAR